MAVQEQVPDSHATAEPSPDAVKRGFSTLTNGEQLTSSVKRAADALITRPLGYVIRRLGLRPDVIHYVRRKAAEESASFVMDRMMPCAVFESRYPLLSLALRQAPTEGLHLEFGVFNGRSINYWSKYRPSHTAHGFDSFEGLREDWAGTGAMRGRFTRHGTLPRVATNVTLHKGWFQDTLPAFLATQARHVPVAFAHLDADTYESTKFVLDQLASRIAPGTVLQFDEYLGYPGWRAGEYRAFSEFCEERGVRFTYLGVGWMSVAVVIDAIDSHLPH